MRRRLRGEEPHGGGPVLAQDGRHGRGEVLHGWGEGDEADADGEGRGGAAAAAAAFVAEELAGEAELVVEFL